MILQALHTYYQRLLEDPDTEIPLEGTSRENISFALVLSPDGTLMEVEDLREQVGKKKRPRKLTVPEVKKRSGTKIDPNFLWDNTVFVLGADNKKEEEKGDDWIVCRHKAFVEQLKKFCVDENDVGLKAILQFYENQHASFIRDRDDWSEISGTNLVFRLDGVPGFIHDRPAARIAWGKYRAGQKKAPRGQCLIEGAEVPLARLHSKIGLPGTKQKGALVAFNKKSFESYGKKQSFNAPVGQRAAFAYTTALNYLLAPDSRQKVRIGDMTLVFWAERQTPVEDIFADLFDPPAEEQQPETVADQGTAIKIRDLLLALRQGKQAVDILPDLDPDVRFYLLGLSPNAARLSIRFWETNRLGTLLTRVSKHFSDISIVRQYDNEPEFPPLWRLLVQTAALGKSENILPLLAGGMARAMLTGAPYPQSLLPVVLDRIRAEGQVTYFRAALLKGFLVRNTRYKEVSMALDNKRRDTAYVLGRLFAVLEKAQEDAIPNTGVTIKDKYLASASAIPGLVFHMLLKNSAHHIAKLRKDSEKKKWAYGYDRKIQEIMDKLAGFPKTLDAEAQGLFMIGYYHQRKDLFTSKKDKGDE
ncbi:type I-C CRISPR-associated protein Cas8c/Csd1 [Desulfomarina sp.]